jgi:hypothetical protein
MATMESFFGKRSVFSWVLGDFFSKPRNTSGLLAIALVAAVIYLFIKDTGWAGQSTTVRVGTLRRLTTSPVSAAPFDLGAKSVQLRVGPFFLPEQSRHHLAH